MQNRNITFYYLNIFYIIIAIIAFLNGCGGGSQANIDVALDNVPLSTNAMAIVNSTNSVTIYWKSSEDNRVKEYRIYRNEEDIGSVTSTMYIDNGLLPGTTYLYRVYPCDEFGKIINDPVVTEVTTYYTLLFQDNIENGFNSDYISQGVEVSTEQSHGGTYSIKANHSVSVVLARSIDSSIISQYKDITIRYWWFTANSWTNGAGVKWSRLRGPNQIIQWENWWTEKLGTEPCTLGGNIYGNSLDLPGAGWYGSYYGAAQSFNRGRWMQIELHYILNTPGMNDGIFSISMDGNVVIRRTGVRFRNTNTHYNLFYFISNIGTPNGNCVNYVDDIEIWAGKP